MADPLKDAPTENARRVVKSLLDGGAPNGIAVADCGPFGSLIDSLFDAHVAGGTKAVRKVFDAQARKNPDVARLRAANDPLAELGIFTAAELQEMDLPEPEYIVEGVLPEGTSLLAAAPKIGKTLLALNISVALATGGRALGKVPVEKARVLFLALEGSKRGLKRRLDTMLQGERFPTNLHIARAWRPMDEGGLDLLRTFIERYRNHELPVRLIVIDTLKRIRGKGNAKRNAYDEDYEALQPIAALGEELGISFLVIHHTNKRDSSDALDLVSGSTGLTGAVDNVLVMQKERGQIDAKLTVIPREEEEQELALSFDAQLVTWILEGQAAEIAKTEEREQVLDVLRGSEHPLRAKDIAIALSRPANNITQLLFKMKKEGKVSQPKYGFYEVHPLLRDTSKTDNSGKTDKADKTDKTQREESY